VSIINRWFGKQNTSPLTNQPAVLFSVDPATKAASQRVERGGHCACLQTRTKKGGPGVPNLHVEPQDLTPLGWGRIVEALRSCEEAGSSVFEPSAQIPANEWAGVITLPSEVGSLKMLKALRLYGSHLRRLPPELGRLSALENLDIYTSYSLHWLPYEVTRCIRLRETRMSTRALYGNRKTRLPFPRLSGVVETLLPDTCSVCDQPFGTASPRLYWTTLRVGTDNAPLLIHSCSEKCTALVPNAPAGYHPRPHKGGGGVGMPY
jgi:hypothetical protein